MTSSPKPLLSTDKQERKDTPIYSGVMKYFPLALAEVARVSKAGNDQHNPGQPLHWAKEKSTDHADCVARHLLESGTVDTDGQRHTGKLAWRALALLEIELEEAAKETNEKSPEPSETFVPPSHKHEYECYRCGTLECCQHCYDDRG